MQRKAHFLSFVLAGVACSMSLAPVSSADAQISIDIGIDVPAYPRLVLVPGYPVYYDPRANSNYFFYDGLYWVYEGDNWYASSWYNGPWESVGPEDVPLFVLRVPVRYYRRPPAYFHGWRASAPPRWGEHWGPDWQARRPGWDRWNRLSAPRAAPLPVYQRRYSGDRYPRAAEQQHSIRSDNYRYRPREVVAQQRLRPQGNPPGSRAEPQRDSQPTQQRQPAQPAQRAQPTQPRPQQVQRPESAPQGKRPGNKDQDQEQCRTPGNCK